VRALEETSLEERMVEDQRRVVQTIVLLINTCD